MSFTIRLGEVWVGVKDFSGAAMAIETVDAEPPAFPGEDENDMLQLVSASGEDAADTSEEANPAPPEEDGFDLLENVDDLTFTPVRAELAEDLAERRRALDAREDTLIQREALLTAAERELDRKYQELTMLRQDIEALLQQQSEQEQERINSLVKIYEGMKAKDAANIFNTLDLDVLIAVMSRMSERKASPILAEMVPERARTVTILLAQQKQLPVLPPAQ